jgi:hypothetical protein
VALVACSAALSGAGFANASVSPTPVVADSGCQALELTKIIDGHDHMFVDPTANNGWCYYQIWNQDTGQLAYGSWTSEGDQPAPNGVYDGPGVHLYVFVTDEWSGAVSGPGPVN